jgi:hypothetical protein
MADIDAGDSVETRTIAPSTGWKVGYVALLLFLAALLLGDAPWRWPPGEWTISLWVAGALGLSCLVAAMDYPFKKVVLGRDFIGQHSWFRWRRRRLPSRVKVFRFGGRVVLADAESGRVLVVLARDFGPARRVEDALKEQLRKSGRLAESEGRPGETQE